MQRQTNVACWQDGSGDLYPNVDVDGRRLAQTYKVLHNFGGPGDGWLPVGQLVFDHNGNLYGVTDVGGYSGARCYVLGCGTVFELAPNPDGTWSES